MLDKIMALAAPDPSLTMREVELQDAEQIHLHCWPERTASTVYQLVARTQQNARQGRGLGVVVIDSKQVIGFGQITIWPRCGEISDLIVSEIYRNRGIGTALIQYLVQRSRLMYVPSVEIGAALSNPGALSLYRRLGFKDDYKLSIDLGNGSEPVMFLRLDLRL